MIQSNAELEVAKYKVLDFIANRKAETLSDIAEALGVSDQVATRLLLSLIKDGRIASFGNRFVLVKNA